MDDRSLISSLFDFSFSHFITPKLQKILYVVVLAICGLGAALTLFAVVRTAGGLFAKLGAVLVGAPVAAIGFLIAAMYIRVCFEVLIVVFRGVEYLREISAAAKNTAEMGATVSTGND